ncbi:MAG: thioredoxin-disulfide reductase [Actinomycetota bacterium]|nr:thioredoxin-disulfide reductase [Actinomycetota bacterium]
MTEAKQKLVIIGSGPAGLTAAIYAARANLQPLIFEGEPSSTSDQPGGQLMLTTDVENYPGFPAGILGPQLMADMRSQAERFGTTLLTRKVNRVDFSQTPFGIWTEDPSSAEPNYTAEAVILSTGAQSVMLGLEAEDRLIGHGLSTCATCDGFFFRDQEIAVVGGGDSAMEEANFLTKFATKVTVIHRRDQLRASKIMQQRAFDNPKIEFVWNAEILKILGQNQVSGLILRDTVNNTQRELLVTGLFIAIGHHPNTGLFTGQLEMDNQGYVKTEADRSVTSVDGVFACGDMQDHRYRQAVTAAGSGCMAAMDAERWLESQVSGIT